MGWVHLLWLDSNCLESSVQVGHIGREEERERESMDISVVYRESLAQVVEAGKSPCIWLTLAMPSPVQIHSRCILHHGAAKLLILVVVSLHFFHFFHIHGTLQWSYCVCNFDHLYLLQLCL
jgi:hypothetical protein